MTTDLAQMDAVAVVEAVQAGTLDPVGYAQSVIERAQDQEHLNALASFDAEYMRQSAKKKASETAQGALWSLPLVVKDNINTTCYPTAGGTTALAEHTPATDAGVIKRLEAAGAYIGAKAGMHELAFGITSNNAATGAIRNPVDPSLIPGGSSGGTAAAIGAGIFPAGLGTDTGGSCRIPAALCGIIGFRPSIGRYEGDGVIPISHSRDTVGPLARSMRDIALLDQVLSGQSYDASPAHMGAVTLGVPSAMFFDDLDPHVAQTIEAALSRLSQAGAKLVDVDFGPIFDHNAAYGFPVVLYEVMRDLPAYLAQHAPQVSLDALVQGIKSPDVAGVIASQLGDDAMPLAAYDAAIHEHGPKMREIYGKVFEEHGLDAIAFPTTPLPARKIGEDETVKLNGNDVPTFPTYIRNTDLGSNLGVPGISIPCAVENGLPVGLELDGLTGKDASLLAVAHGAAQAMKR